jgi:hypothetical protein
MKITPNNYLFIFLLFASFLSGQSTVVLINEVPTRVEIDGGEITAINEKVPSYMRGYEKSPKDAFRKLWPGEDLPVLADNQTDGDAIAESNAVLPKEAISFKANSYELGEDTKANLAKLAQQIREENRTSVVLKSWYKIGDFQSQDLTINRLDACKDFLVTNGVQGSLIVTSFTGTEKQVNHVQATLK